MNALLDKSILVYPLIVLSASFDLIKLKFIIAISLYQSQLVLLMLGVMKARVSTNIVLANI